MLAGLQQPLGQRTPGAVGALDGPDPLRPCLRIGPHRGVTGMVGADTAEARGWISEADRHRRLIERLDEHIRQAEAG